MSKTSLWSIRSGKNQRIAVIVPRRNADGATIANDPMRYRMGTASRRMTEMARHWVSAVIPCERTGPWVLSPLFELCVPLAYQRPHARRAWRGRASDRGLVSRQGRELGIADGRTGSITAVQRFGSDLALTVHFDMLFLDGV